MVTSQVTDKTGLLNQFNNLNQTYTLGVAAIGLYSDERTIEILETMPFTWGPLPTFGPDIAAALRDPAGRRQMLSEYASLLSRAIIKEGFEAIKAYCALTHQDASLRSQPWYYFARTVRNAVSHDGYIHFNDSERKRLPITWRTYTIDASSEGQPVGAVLPSHLDVLWLAAEMRVFVEDVLT
jgi:hypothetical protein